MKGKPTPTGSAELASGSPAHGLGRKQDPKARMVEHAEKQKARLARQVGTPGPGSYTPAAPASSSSKKGSATGTSAAFASKSKRSDFTKEQLGQGDPGAYDAGRTSTLAAASKKSVSKSNRAGSGSFGAQEQRTLAIDIMGEATPGPGAYNGERMMRNGKVAALAAMDTGERMPMSSFKSKSAQREKATNQHVPGAGAYTPAFEAIEKKPRNPAASMKAKGDRFRGADTWERAQSKEPGPGAYEIEFLRTGAKSSLSGMSQTTHSKASMTGAIAFGTEATRDLPWES